jgi:hypothetical protein
MEANCRIWPRKLFHIQQARARAGARNWSTQVLEGRRDYISPASLSAPFSIGLSNCRIWVRRLLQSQQASMARSSCRRARLSMEAPPSIFMWSKRLTRKRLLICVYDSA